MLCLRIVQNKNLAGMIALKDVGSILQHLGSRRPSFQATFLFRFLQIWRLLLKFLAIPVGQRRTGLVGALEEL